MQGWPNAVGANSGPDSHALGLQCEDCFMGDSTAGIMKKRQGNKVNRSLFLANDSQTPIPLIRTESLLDLKIPKCVSFNILIPQP